MKGKKPRLSIKGQRNYVRDREIIEIRVIEIERVHCDSICVIVGTVISLSVFAFVRVCLLSGAE